MLMLMSPITMFVVLLPILKFDALIMHGGSKSVRILVIHNTDWTKMMMMMLCCDPHSSFYY